jgi:hypothetical protein
VLQIWLSSAIGDLLQAKVPLVEHSAAAPSGKPVGARKLRGPNVRK